MFHLQCHRHHHDLHSFPTRRSSDLIGEPSLHVLERVESCLHVVTAAHPLLQLFYRSEEHTSELQSHHDLVCRLLLAKKKCRHSRRILAAAIPSTRRPHPTTTPPGPA